MPNREDAVSEAIGGVLLIALVVIGAAIVGTYVASQPLPEKIPKVQFNVKGNEYRTILYLEHEGGESLNEGTFNVTLNGGKPVSIEDFPEDGSWSLGERLRIPVPASEFPATSVGLVYTGGSGDTLLRSVGSDMSFYQFFSAPDPSEVVDVPDYSADWPLGVGDFTCWTYKWPAGYDPQPTFTPAPGNLKHVYVAAVDSHITPPEPPLFVCDGTNDEREINDAIAIAQGGVVELLDGKFSCSGRITLRDHTTLTGQGSRGGAIGQGGTVIETIKSGGSGYLPIAVGAEYVNLNGFTIRGNAFVLITESHVRLRDIWASSVTEDGVWHKASGNGMFFVWVARTSNDKDKTTIDDVEFYRCTAFQCHTHGFNMNQDYSDHVARATTNIRFVQCGAAQCGYGVAGDPGIPASVTSTNESRSEWITGFDLHEWQNLVNCEVVNCVAENNWESGFHLEPGARYTEPPGPRTVSKNIVFRDCISSNNGRSTYASHFFMSGYYLSRDTRLENCLSQNNRNAGYYVHGGQNSSFIGCKDVGSTYGWKVCKASEDITLTGCSSENNLRWALWLSFSRRIIVEDFHQVDVTGDRGYQNMLGWYKDEPKYQQPVTDSLLDITASGNTMPIINRAGSGNRYYLYYG